jgi:short-subunit dehydrogenase
MRERGAGVVVNVTSSVTYTPLPLLSVYTASKAAVNAFGESLALELAAFNIRVVNVLPGRAPQTQFGASARSKLQAHGGFPEAYAAYAQSVFAAMGQAADVTHAHDVAQAIWRAATDPACPISLPAGADAVALAGA